MTDAQKTEAAQDAREFAEAEAFLGRTYQMFSRARCGFGVLCALAASASFVLHSWYAAAAVSSLLALDTLCGRGVVGRACVALSVYAHTDAGLYRSFEFAFS